MPNEHRIRALARNILQAGRMPRREDDGTWGGKGVDVPGAICGERIRPDHLEYELQFSQEGATPDVDLFHLHLRCFAAWEMERTKAASESDTPWSARRMEVWFRDACESGFIKVPPSAWIALARPR